MAASKMMPAEHTQQVRQCLDFNFSGELVFQWILFLPKLLKWEMRKGFSTMKKRLFMICKKPGMGKKVWKDAQL